MSKLKLGVINRKPLTKAASKRLEVRDRLWPEDVRQLWHRLDEDGFTTIPRTLPLVMALLDQLRTKGKDAARVYLDLWCRQMDDSFVDVTSEADFAFSSGFISDRNVRSWQERIRELEELGFVKVESRGNRKFGYILLRHPHRVVKELREKNLVPQNWWNAYGQCAADYGMKLP